MRLIDADALTDDTYILNSWDAPIVRAWLDEQPTVDAKEVVHGHWISRGYKIECSVCGHRSFLGTHDPVIHTEEKSICKYCPNCGADMRERKDNGD